MSRKKQFFYVRENEKEIKWIRRRRRRKHTTNYWL
jgi:hypothetical protein